MVGSLTGQYNSTCCTGTDHETFRLGWVGECDQSTNARKVNCVHIETSSLWAEFVNKNICISARLVSEGIKTFNFDNFENSHDSLLRPEYFID